MSFQPITHLRHVDLAVPDFERQRAFYGTTWGLTEVAGDSGIAFFAAEGSPEQYIVRIRSDERKRMDLVAFGAVSPAAVDELHVRLGRAGVQLIGEPRALDTPGGGYGFRFFDPDGRVVEVSADVATRAHRKIEEREAIPVRLSHCVVNSQDPEGLRDFYVEHLGFRLTDTLYSTHMGDLMYFLRCSPCTTPSPSPAAPMSPCTTPRSRCAASRSTCAAPDARCAPGPGSPGGRDGISRATTPSPTSTTRTATPWSTPPNWPSSKRTWQHPGRHDVDDPITQDQWGTADPMSESVAKEQFNDPDVLFVAPPV